MMKLNLPFQEITLGWWNVRKNRRRTILTLLPSWLDA